MIVDYAMHPELPARLFGRAEAPLTEFTSQASRRRLKTTEILITGWGCPVLDAEALDAAPLLKAVVHAAGSVKGHVTPEVFARGIVVSSAADANAIPVAEFTLAMILLANKAVPRLVREYHAAREDLGLLTQHNDLGNYRKVVGIVGASRIGRRVIELLRPFDLQVLVADPYATDLVTHDLDEVVGRSDVVSIHAPATRETYRMMGAERLRALKDGATLINTARGSLVDEAALIAELQKRRIFAILDVTDPEPPAADSPLWTLPNVVLTPHVAGALGSEVARLGAAALDEVVRLTRGAPLKYEVDPRVLSYQA
ncbi:hydroxyacid dehydrogenase [Herbidospora mongoliensis]|uniref:hydroxyacid dehydrogenase n=1 Tax=Herbidospora mongoliensis TaxID=688067 RepID=UPI000B105E54|nr:hydroxyacid dehydrogenase [Herbidospora mongoliensis]